MSNKILVPLYGVVAITISILGLFYLTNKFNTSLSYAEVYSIISNYIYPIILVFVLVLLTKYVRTRKLSFIFIVLNLVICLAIPLWMLGVLGFSELVTGNVWVVTIVVLVLGVYVYCIVLFGSKN